MRLQWGRVSGKRPPGSDHSWDGNTSVARGRTQAVYDTLLQIVKEDNIGDFSEMRNDIDRGWGRRHMANHKSTLRFYRWYCCGGLEGRQDDPIRRILGGGGDWHDRVLESNRDPFHGADEGHADKARRTDRPGVWELGVAITRPWRTAYRALERSRKTGRRDKHTRIARTSAENSRLD